MAGPVPSSDVAAPECDTQCVMKQIGSQVLLFILLTGMAGSVDTDMLKHSFTHKWKGIVLGCSCQFALLPALGFSSAKLFDLDSVYGIALITTTASPGGAYSNWWCSLMNADLALSLAMTACSTVLAAIFMPLNLLIWTAIAYAESPSLEFPKLALNIGVAIAGILTGTIFSLRRPSARRNMNIVGNVAGLFLIGFGVIVSSHDDGAFHKGGMHYAAVSAPCLMGLVAAFSLAFISPALSNPEAIAVTVETCYQNTGLALSICLATFRGSEQGQAAGVPILYAMTQLIVLPCFLVVSWKLGLTYAPPSTSVYRLLGEDWQPKITATNDVEQDSAEQPSNGDENTSMREANSIGASDVQLTSSN